MSNAVPVTTSGEVPIIQYEHRDLRLVRRAINRGWNVTPRILEGLPTHLYAIVVNESPEPGKPPPDFEDHNRLLAAKLLVDMTKVNAVLEGEAEPTYDDECNRPDLSADEKRNLARALLVAEFTRRGPEGGVNYRGAESETDQRGEFDADAVRGEST